MALSISMTPHETFLEVVVTGSFDVQDAVDLFSEVLSACCTAGLSRAIIDYRSTGGIQAAMDKILYAFGVQDHYLAYLAAGGPELRVAYLGSPLHVNEWEPGLQVARDSNMQFELFTDLQAAHEWLGVDPP